MTKAYTADDFCDQITQDRNWRLKEIIDLKTAIVRADKRLQIVLLRALVPMCYAHWEGYVRFSALKFMEHVALRRHQYVQLNRQFLRNFFIPKLGSIAGSKIDIKSRCQLIDEILDLGYEKFSQRDASLINTKSNLNFEVFSEICLVCNIPINNFSDKNSFIDIVLLKRRNAIAHGEEVLISIDELDEIASATTEIMRMFGNELENSVVSQSYLVA